MTTRSLIKLAAMLLVVAGAADPAQGRANDEPATKSKKPVSEQPDYGELNIINTYAHPEDKEQHIPPVAGMARYFAFKDSLRSRSGFGYMIEYAPILQWGAGEFHADHELNLIGLWNLVDSNRGGRGNLFVWFQHALTWSDLTTSEFMDSLGVISPVNGGDTFPERSANRFQLLAWEHLLMDEALRMMIGKITTRVTFNQNRYAVSDREDFFSPMIVNNPVVPFTARVGLAVFGQFRRGTWYISGMVRDADASDDFVDFESLDSGNWEYTAEAAFTPILPNIGEGNYRVTFHYTDAIGEGATQQAAGTSLSLSLDQDVGDNIGTFFRFAHTDTPLRTFRQRLAAGAQILGPLGYDDDRVGLGFWSGRPTDSSLENEYGIEGFWRLQLARMAELTPNVQIIFSPAREPDRNARPIFGLRLRMVF